jgi:hypothetical protein
MEEPRVRTFAEAVVGCQQPQDARELPLLDASHFADLGDVHPSGFL